MVVRDHLNDSDERDGVEQPHTAGGLQAGMLSVTLVWLVLVVLIAAVVLTLVGERQIRITLDREAQIVAQLSAAEILRNQDITSEGELLEVVRETFPGIAKLRVLPAGIAAPRTTRNGWAISRLPSGRTVEVTLVPDSGGPARMLNTFGILASLGTLFLLMSVFLVVMVGRMIGRPINQVAEQAARLAAGNLTRPASQLRAGQFGRIGASLEAVRDRMATDMEQSEQASEELHQTNSLQRLMLRELNHRIRNNLASLGALIAISRTQSTEVPEFARRIERRVDAMASAHSLLSERHWTPVAVQTLLERLAPIECVERMSLRGDDVSVSAAQATPLAMVLQEMFANAMEHGSLGSGAGWLSVEWDVGEGHDGEILVILWKESGGAPPDPDAEAGTGTTLIRGLIEGELRGEITLHHAPTGVSHRIRIPLEPGGSIGAI